MVGDVMVGEECGGCSPQPPPPPVVATLMSLSLLCCPQPPHTAFPHPPKQSGSWWRSSTPDKPTSVALRGHHCWPSAHANGPSPKNIGTLETWHSLDAHSLPDTVCCKSHSFQRWECGHSRRRRKPSRDRSTVRKMKLAWPGPKPVALVMAVPWVSGRYFSLSTCYT